MPRRKIPEFLMQEPAIPEPETGPLQVGVTGRHPALDFPDIPPPLTAREVPEFAPTPVKTTAETRRLLDLLAAPPEREKPGILRRILAGAAGGAEGYFRGAGPGIALATEVLEEPYKRKVAEFGAEVGRAQIAATAAEKAQEERRKREEREFELGVKGVEARARGEEAVTRRFATIAQTKGAAAELARLRQVGPVILDQESGEFFNLPRYGGAPTPTGLKGATEAEKSALRLKNQLTVLRQFPKFFNVPANAYALALKGEIMSEILNEPALQHFFDEKTGLPTEMSPEELEEPYDDTKTKGQAYEELLNRLQIRVQERLGATKRQPGGVTTEPGERYRIVE